MLPLKLVRSLVLGETINNPLCLTQQHTHLDHNDVDTNDDEDDDDDDDDDEANNAIPHRKQTRGRRRRKTSTDKNSKTKKTPFLLFLPTKELITDTYRLATIARDMGMDLHPTPSLSHIIFSYPSSPSPSTSASSSSSSTPSPSSPFPISWSWSSSSLSSSFLPNDAVPLPFPSLTTASLTHLRSFATLSKGLFKLAFANFTTKATIADTTSNWDCCSVSLFSRLTSDRVDTMDAFSRALAGMGWTLFKTKQNPSQDLKEKRVWGGNSVFLFRKVESNRVRAGRVNECRIRELRLPPLDFRNAPLRILQYILLMTDDIFYLS
ncbi:uncharacterized protein LOC126702584 [Quercus robur]|uniref:uncharacterized protein LOC126702584 n=1 Tax=Quercus robur TaxID=38942 RepID=UPI002162FB3B|nr:uncharacterized protein LOC126702584 [Quercus robur]